MGFLYHAMSILPSSQHRLSSFSMQLGLEEALPSLVKAKFATAKASQALIFSSTELSILRNKSGAPVSCIISTRIARDVQAIKASLCILTNTPVPTSLLSGIGKKAHRQQ